MKGIFKGPRNNECWWPNGYNKRPHKLVAADLKMLKCNVVTKVDREQLKIISMKPTPLLQTPHYQYAIGNKSVYEEYLNMLKHITWARKAVNQEHLDIQHMFDKFDVVLDSQMYYLEPPHENKYIICNIHQLIIDGIHRSVSLLANKIEKAPVALVGW